ncbi:MASE1 domain-containing protein [Catellatospora paridis]|uniref:MASE1 domain-containing protein n=1 Tax=Catellatospora paridis TaxID=1617086 RepID=UPI0012D45499|nr:MASE1 domain-containing protein [Catellatospora paridis]
MTAIAGDQGKRGRLPRSVTVGLQILGVAAAYYVAARIGLLQELVRGQVTPLWPPTGVALVCLLLWGARVWPGIALGAFLINAPIGPSAVAIVAITTGNTLAPLCAYGMLRRVGFRVELDRLRDGLALVLLGALAGMLVSATIGSAALRAAGAIEAGDFWTVWSVWWTGDAMGVLVIAPLLLVLRTARRPRDVPVRRYVEAAALLISALAVTVTVTRVPINLLFLVFPFVIWAAVRFQLGGAACCVLGVTGLAIHAAAVGAGPFAGQDLLVKMITLQAFNGSAALTGLLLAALTTERNLAFRLLERATRQLSDVATELD